MNKFIFSGNLTREPERRSTASGEDVCSFTVAGRYDRDTPVFIPCTTFGALATNCFEYLHKGSKVLIAARVKQVEFTDREGKKRTATDYICSEVEFLSKKEPEHEHAAEPKEPEPAVEDDLPF